MKRLTIGGLFFSIFVLLLIPYISFAQVVTSTADSGMGTLREAIDNATGGEVITFNLPGAPPHTITLNSELLIDVALTINGLGKNDLIISGGGNSRIFNIDAGGIFASVAIRDLTIRNGNATGGGGTAGQKGGGIFNREFLTLEDCEMSDNTSGGDADGGGGAIAHRGSLMFVRRCDFLNNQNSDFTNDSVGGAIDASATSSTVLGSMTIEDCRFEGNFAEGANIARGGALYISRGVIDTANPSANISRTEFLSNFSTADTATGGAIHSDSGILTMTNIVVLGNSADGFVEGTGGGIYIFQRGSTMAILDLLNATVSQNTARGELARGGGIYFQGAGTATLTNILTNLTISENISLAASAFSIASSFGGAIYIDDAQIDLLASTMVFNEANGPDGAELTGAGMFARGTIPRIRYKNTIIAQNTLRNSGGTRSFSTTTRGPGMLDLLVPNCALDVGGMITAYQLNGTANITDSDLAEDQCRFAFNADFDGSTMLGSLQDNGGFTLTHALIDTLFPTNPAIDSIPDGDCTADLEIITRRIEDPFGLNGSKEFYLIDTPENLEYSILDNWSVYGAFEDNLSLLPLDYAVNETNGSSLDNFIRLITDEEPTDSGLYSSRFTQNLRGPAMDPQNPNDGRPFPRPFDWFGSGTALCDAGSYELQVTGTIFVEKVSDPFNGMGFEFLGTNFPLGCDLDGMFTLDDFELTSGCVVPEGAYTVEETNNQGFPFLSIDCGQPAAIITPDIPNSLVSIEVTNGGGTVFCTFLNSVNPRLRVSLQGSGSGSATSNPAGIDCPFVDCTQDFPAGTNITLSAVADPGSVFDGWSGDCAATTMDQTTITLNASSTCVATFTLLPPPLLSIQIIGEGGVTSMDTAIDCNSVGTMNCNQLYPLNAPVILTAAAQPGSVFNSWSGDSACTGDPTNPILMLTMSNDISCTANFDISQANLNLEVNGAGQGGVTSTPPGQIDCSNNGASDCDETYNVGEMVTLTAMPEPGSVFNSWSGDSACSGDATNPTLALTMSADISCTATFDIEQVTFDIMVLGPGTGGVTSTTSGQIDCSNTGATDCNETYNSGAMVTLTADPDPGSMFVTWGGDSACIGSPTNSVLTVTMSTDISCTAMFSLLPVPVVLDVTISGNGDGGVTSATTGIDCSSTGATDCDESYTFGTMVTLTAALGQNSLFTGWSGDSACTGNPTNPILTLTMSSDISCIATFIIDPITQLVTLDVEIEGNGTGTVTSSPLAIDCLGDCTEIVAPGTTFTLTATPGPNSEFVGWGEDCIGEDTETMITVNADSLCIATFVLTNFSLNPILPALDDNINFISAENASPGGNVAFTWSRRTGSLTVGGRVCNGTELGLRNPRILSIVRANDFGVATHIFYIPTFGDLEFQVELQAVDIETCRTSNIVPQIIRKDEGG